jgi:hypothetical protein
MAYHYHSGAPGGAASNAHLDRQMRERQQQIDAVTEALVVRTAVFIAASFVFNNIALFQDRYSPRRSPDALPNPEYHTYAGVFQPAWTYSDSPPSSQGVYHEVVAGPPHFSDSEELHVSARPLTPVYSTRSAAGRRAQATASTYSSYPQSGGFVEESDRAYYRSHVSEYPPSLAPVPTAVEGEVRKIYTKRPMHVAPPAPEADNHEAYMREAFSVGADVPLRLESLRDPPAGTRPQYPLPFLCALAIHGSPNRALPSAGIAEALCARFEWFRDNDDSSSNKGWRVSFPFLLPSLASTDDCIVTQASVRHLLSLHLIFRAMPRPSNIAGKGSYWKLDFTRGIGNKRPRKRRGRGAVVAAAVGPERSPSGESDNISDSE